MLYKRPTFLVRNSWINLINLSLIGTNNNSFFMSKMKIYFLTDIFPPLNTHFSIMVKSSHLEVFLGNGTLKICSKFTGKHPCRSVISINLLCNFIEIALRHECSPVNSLFSFRTPPPKNTSGRRFLLWYRSRLPTFKL